MNKLIEDDIIYLRNIEDADTSMVVSWRNSEGVRSHFIYQKELTEEDHRNWLETNVYTHKCEQCIICIKSSAIDSGLVEANPEVLEYLSNETDGDEGYPVGSVYIRDIDRNHRKGEYGIFIGEGDFRGAGIGSRACKLMCEYAFKSLDLHKLMLRVHADNERAIKSYARAGFEKEAYLKDDVFVNGRYTDIVLMGLINPMEVNNG